MTITRPVYIGLAAGTIVVGLAVHFAGSALAPAARDLLGDALWAIMIVWLLGGIAPRSPIRARAAVALATCFVVELGQIYHAPALDAVRRTTFGHLLLGSGFDPRDLLAYTGGVLAASLGEVSWIRRGPPSNDPQRSRLSPEL